MNITDAVNSLLQAHIAISECFDEQPSIGIDSSNKSIHLFNLNDLDNVPGEASLKERFSDYYPCQFEKQYCGIVFFCLVPRSEKLR